MGRHNRRSLIESLEGRLLLSRIALISDFGTLQGSEGDVANMIKGWDAQARLDAIVTSGDNDQNNGDDYANRVGNYYGQFIYGRGSATQRFLPVPGNHDWGYNSGRGTLTYYEDYFSIPDASQGNTSGNERYYNYKIGDVEVFMLDSDPHEPDGTSSTSVQAQWLQNALAKSTAAWQIVSFHHAAYSSSSAHYSSTWMQWPFQDWGVDLVVNGHNHVYERVNVSGLRFVTNGMGGWDGLNAFGTTVAGSEKQYNAENGAILLEANSTTLSYQFINTRGEVIDTYSMTNVPLPNIAVSAANASEAGQNGGFTFTRSNVMTGNVTVKYTISGTATSGVDYEPIPLSVAIPDGVASVTVPLKAITDTLPEGDETVILTINDDPAYVRRNTTATATIVDDDMQTATFQTGADTYIHSYNPNTSYGTATSLNIDTDDPVGSGGFEQSLISFPSLIGSNVGQIPFGSTILSAKLQLNVTNVGNTVNLYRMVTGWTDASTWNSLGGGVQIGTETVHSIDASFTPSATGLYTVDVTSSLRAWLANPSSNLGWALNPTGTDGVDIDSLEGAIKPKLVVNYAAPANLPRVSIATKANAAEPSTPGEFTITRGEGADLNVPLTVYFSVTGSASTGSDYSALGTSVVIPAGSVSVAVPLNVKDDSTYEGDESVVVTLVTDPAYIITSGSATAIITDDEPVPSEINIQATDPTAGEPAASGEFTITRSNNTGNLTVKYDIGGSAVNGTDYQLLIGSVEIPDGQYSVTVSINPSDDALAEHDETVVLTLREDQAYTVGTASATVTIADDDLRVASFEQATDTNLMARTPDTSYATATSLTVNTDDRRPSRSSQALLRFDNLFGVITGQIATGSQILSATLELNVTAPGSAINLYRMLTSWSSSDTWNSLGGGVQANGSEAMATPDATFTPSTAGLCSINVTNALRAWAADPTSNFGWVLINSGSDAVSFNSSEGTITPRLVVEYCDPVPLPEVTISANVPSASEAGEPAQFTVTRTGDQGSSLTVFYAIGGTATAGTGYDYTPLAGSVTIPAGATFATIDLTPLDDSIYEGDETVVLTLSPHSEYALGLPSTATATITDDDPATVVTITPATTTISEASGPTQFTFTRTGNLTTSLTVGYTVGGTAMAGSDYTALSGSVTIPADAASVTVDLEPKQDLITEDGGETVILTLGEGTGYILGSSNTATATITDSETLPVVTITPDSAVISEAGGRVDFNVTRSDTGATDLVVTYSVTGTATAGSDYEVLTGTVTIAAGQTAASFSLVAINDSDYEPDETVIVSLNDGGLGTAVSSTVTIESDDVQSAPAAPTNLTGRANSGCVIDLAWVDNATDETGYVLEWSQDGSNWSEWSTAAPLPANATAFTVNGGGVLQKATFYYFRVRAINVAGSSDSSNVLKIRTANK